MHPDDRTVKITCVHCGNIYVANKKGRTHCRRTGCRAKEIRTQMDNLKAFVEMFCLNKIEAVIEIRLPGNDKLGPEAKIDSFSILTRNLEEKNNNNTGGLKLDELITYFEPLLWKGIKGNFIVSTLADGTLSPKLLSQTFTSISDPVVIGNNLIVTGQKIKNEGGKRL